MANFLVVVDPDPGRRARYCQVAGPRLAMLEGLVTGECAAGDFAAMWASGPRAPVTSWSDGTGVAVLWGRALADDDGRAIEAAELPALWADVARAMPPAFDGYHAAVSYHPHRGLTVGADILGMYPVFWWSDGTVHLVGSSPELFRHHPRFRWGLDLAGLVGILLTTHSVGGRTLMDSVRRLAPGHLLAVPPASLPREVRQYDLPVSTDYFDLPYSRALELLHDTLSAAVARHVPSDADSTIALSGGRDSRLLAGLMARAGRPFNALTFGEADDFEMRCASGVAKVLGVEHHKIPVTFDADCVSQQTRWLHCSTGYSGVSYWRSQGALVSLSAFLVNGYTMDSVVGGSNIAWAYSDDTGAPSFASLLSRVSSHGFNVAQLSGLLRGEIWKDVLDQLVHQLRDAYQSYSSFDAQRAWAFALYHRQRLNLGNPPWVLSFGAWPIMPAIDKRVLKVAGGLPAGVLAERRAQDDMIRNYYPALAELPLDRNSPDMTPLTLRIRHRVARDLLARIEPVTRRLHSNRGRERRYYYRLYDFNSTAWKGARQKAEPARSKLHQLFEARVLSQLLPSPDVDVQLTNSLAATDGMKVLVGLSLWAEEYL